MEIKLTKSQQEAVDAKGHILVTAAAGSGKTAILTKRIIRLIKSERIDVTKLVIITFTKAAANEMKVRIKKALNEELLKNINNKNVATFLKKQIKDLSKANICTLHSFCNSLIKENFFVLNLPSKIQIGSDEKIQTIKLESVDKTLEYMYDQARENGDFVDIVNDFVSAKGDGVFKENFLNIISFLDSIPFKDEYFEENISLVDSVLNGEKSFLEIPFVVEYLEQIKAPLLFVKDMLKQAIDEVLSLDYALSHDNIQKMHDVLKMDMQICDVLLEKLDQKPLEFETLEEIKNILENLTFAKWPIIRGAKEYTESVKEKRDTCKKAFEDILGKTPMFSKEQIMFELAKTNTIQKQLYELYKVYLQIFQKEKHDNHIIDYADLESYAIKILYDKDKSFSPIAKQLQEEYVEVLVDEYQDINMMQEYIINAITPQNLFQVGDAKQSIYGFRNARPDLFIYKQDKCDKTNVIYLNANFRSEYNVLDFANAIFKNLMQEGISDIIYTKDQYLNLPDHKKERKDLDPIFANEILLIDSDIDVKGNSEEEQEEDKDKEQEDNVNNDNGINEISLEEQEIESKIEKEAHVLAQKILAMKKEYAKKGEELKFADIAILLRSVQSRGHIYKDVLEKYNISVNVESEENFFEIAQIELVLNYFAVIANPLLDIPLLSVLRSYFFGFDINELTTISIFSNKDTFFEKMLDFKENAKLVTNFDENIQNICVKISNVLDNFELCKNILNYKGIGALATYIIQDTRYIDYEKISSNYGEYIQENLLNFIDKCYVLEKAGITSLEEFNFQIQRIREKALKVPTTASVDEKEDSVKIMTIHKSKGLEFKVVILANADKKKNNMDLAYPIRAIANMPFGIDIVNASENYYYPSTIKSIINSYKDKIELQEEIRVLYVALTRAKQKLIVSSCIKNVDKYISKIEALNTINYYTLYKNYDYLTWVILASKIAKQEYANMKSLGKISKEDIIPTIQYVLPNYKVIKELDDVLKEEVQKGEQLEQLKEYVDSEKDLASQYDKEAISKIQSSIYKVDISKIEKDISDVILKNEKLNEKIEKNNSKNKDEKQLEEERLKEKYIKTQIIEPSTNVIVEKISVSNITSRLKQSSIEKEQYMSDVENGTVVENGNENIDDSDVLDITEEKIANILFEAPDFVKLKRIEEKENSNQKENNNQNQNEEKDNLDIEALQTLGIKRGNVTHYIFEKLPITKQFLKASKSDFVSTYKEFLNTLKDYDKDDYSLVSKKRVMEFIYSDIYKELIDSKVFKEQPFYLKIDREYARYLTKESGVDVFEGQIIQGIIDLLAIDTNKKVVYIVDYKTDSLDKKEFFVQKYSLQLQIYKKALERMYGSDFEYKTYIYSTKNAQFYEI